MDKQYYKLKRIALVAMFFISSTLVLGCASSGSMTNQIKVYNQKMALPAIKEKALLTFAPEVPPPIQRKEPAIVEVHLNSSIKMTEIKPGVQYEYWTFDGEVPGPFIRTRVGDVLEIHHTSTDETGMPHNIDFHAVTGPGGGAPVTTVVKGEKKIAWFRLLHPGLYIYHCAAPPVMDHIANGMYGLILVEPEEGLQDVDREFYVMQHEVYGRFGGDPQTAHAGHDMVAAEAPEAKAEEEPIDDFWLDEGAEVSTGPVEEGQLVFSHADGLDENPKYIFFNGRYNRHLGEEALKAKVGDKVRIYFGNIGPNLISSFHVIGEVFDNVYREGDLISPPGRSIQTTLVPAGGAAVVEFGVEVPGTFTLVDHAIFRVAKGAVGYLEVEGEPNYSIYVSDQEAELCPGCMVHP